MYGNVTAFSAERRSSGIFDGGGRKKRSEVKERMKGQRTEGGWEDMGSRYKESKIKRRLQRPLEHGYYVFVPLRGGIS